MTRADLTGRTASGGVCGRTGERGVKSGVKSTMEATVARSGARTPLTTRDIPASSRANAAMVRAVRMGKARISEPGVDEGRGPASGEQLNRDYRQRHGGGLDIDRSAGEQVDRAVVPVLRHGLTGRSQE